MQQQTDYQQVGVFSGWNPRRQSPVPANLHSSLRHGGLRQPFTWSGCEDSTVALHVALRLFLALVMFPLLLLADESGNITGKVVESAAEG